VGRSRDDLAEEIVDNLSGCKRRVEARRAVLRYIEIGEELAPGLSPQALRTIGERVKRARKAVKLAAAFGDPNLLRATYEARTLMAMGLKHYRGDIDPRRGHLQEFCAAAAYHLIKEFSTDRPVSTQDKNMHVIAQLLREAIAGKSGSGTDTLRACKVMLSYLSG
jgi:hypothetical protein